MKWFSISYIKIKLLGLSILFTFSVLGETEFFTNPIIPPPSADPFIVQHDGYYYHIFKNNIGIAIRKTQDITKLAQARSICVWRPPSSGPYSHEIWAPELHRYNGKWYIYVAADDGKNENHQMWAIESEGDDPMGPYNQIPYHLETGGWAIDGTLLTDSQNNPYFIWSGWPGKVDGTQYLYIAPMESPTKITAQRTLLSIPDQPWEKHGMPLLEGPQILKNNGKIFIIYSASGSWTVDYCLGMLEYKGGDICNPNNWEKHTKAPVLSKKDKVLGTGHCSFFKSPDGKEDWIAYHTKTKHENGWGDRCVHIQPYTFNEKGHPVFGEPAQPDQKLKSPSGSISTSVSQLIRDNYSDTWVATDALGRTLPTSQDVGIPKENRSIGMFYFLWMGAHGTNGPFDVTQILKKHPEAINNENHPAWGPLNAFHHWGESWFGYYLSTDESVYEKHARMLADMGVDVIIFDASNQFTYRDQYMALCRAFTRVRNNAGQTPQIAFLCPFGFPKNTVLKLWDEFYSQNLYSNLWYQWEGKPLILADPSLCTAGTVWDKHDYADPVPQNGSLGLSFQLQKSAYSIAAAAPTWHTTNSSVTLTLYKESPQGSLILQKRFSSISDNSWLELKFEKGLPIGKYYLEMSSPENKIGWWSTSSKNSDIPDAQSWHNQEMVSGARDLKIIYQDDPFLAINTFFSFRKPQADYFSGPTGPNQWGWLEVYPQHPFYNERHQLEQMTVGVAQNALDGKLSVLSNPKSHGRSFHNGIQPPPEEQNNRGNNFQEQWNRALQIDPPFIFITGWNEWVMMRFNKQNSPFYGSGNVTFVDQFNEEYSRDIEPALAKHGDNYYYQTIANIRKYKGVREIEPVSSAPIQIDGVFTDWIPVYPEFRDDIGDPVHRNHSGWGKSGIYKNHTGRNDIISAKISISKNNLYTYVRTFEPMHAIKQDHWMLLFLDTDENSTNGWMGYDFMIRSHPENIDQALVQKHTGSIGQYCWENITSVKRCINGTQMEIEIPLEILKLDSETLQYVDFKWADNIQETGEARDLTINGDVAPNDRYNYRAIFRKKRTEK